METMVWTVDKLTLTLTNSDNVDLTQKSFSSHGRRIIEFLNKLPVDSSSLVGVQLP